ncbi:NUDIX domain-containing protein [Corynebacterium sp. 3HC-13]|uniref:NAD(+) diphosphatase n=1 Tax=Corynebacterium poyangense TaxID=2684405 RepID=UPI001CCABBE9|nr:NAD(+) diphosphatase [Corynebacterium poyangense]MBZ8176904.1 NUDIX domain-containing protein [Corynebacterium poyangense]
MKYLCIDPHGRLAAHTTKDHRVHPVVLDAIPAGAISSTRVQIDADLSALRVDERTVATVANQYEAEVIGPRGYANNPQLARALALIRNRERLRFDPVDGYPVDFDDAGIIGHGLNGPIFPRIDPAVIGIIELVGEEKILLAKNSQRPEYYSLVAGYVEAGESFESAFIREAAEETGRTVHSLTYQGSQPWPATSSLMVGFHAFTAEVEPSLPTDGEIAHTVWLGAKEISQVPLPMPGSIAYRLIDGWVRTHGGGPLG